MEIEFVERLTRVEESAKSAHHRIDNVEQIQREIHQLAISVNSIAQSVQQMQQNHDNMACRLEELESRPVKDWDRLKWIIISIIASGIISSLLTYLGIHK